MINKFPKLNNKTKKKLLEWLDIQIINDRSDALKYEACGNTEESLKHNAYASQLESMKIYIEYHMEK